MREQLRELYSSADPLHHRQALALADALGVEGWQALFPDAAIRDGRLLGVSGVRDVFVCLDGPSDPAEGAAWRRHLDTAALRHLELRTSKPMALPELHHLPLRTLSLAGFDRLEALVLPDTLEVLDVQTPNIGLRTLRVGPALRVFTAVRTGLSDLQQVSRARLEALRIWSKPYLSSLAGLPLSIRALELHDDGNIVDPGPLARCLLLDLPSLAGLMSSRSACVRAAALENARSSELRTRRLVAMVRWGRKGGVVLPLRHHVRDEKMVPGHKRLTMSAEWQALLAGQRPPRLLALSKRHDLSSLSGVLTAEDRQVSIDGAGALVDISAMRAATELHTVHLRGVPRLTDLSPLSGLPKLTELNLSGATALRDLSPLSGLPALKKLRLCRLASLEGLSGLGHLPVLGRLNLSGTPLKRLDGLDAPELQKLIMVGAPALESLSGLSACPQLAHLTLRDAPLLLGLEGVASARLDEIRLHRCDGLTSLGGLRGARLGRLELDQCGGLEVVQGLSGLSCSSVTLRWLRRLRGLDLSAVRSQFLGVSHCERLSTVCYPSGLLTLSFSDCARLVRLPSLAGSAVQHLALHRCRQLAALPSLDGLTLNALSLSMMSLPLDPLRGATVKRLSLYGMSGLDLGPLADVDVEDIDLSGGMALEDVRGWEGVRGCRRVRVQVRGSLMALRALPPGCRAYIPRGDKDAIAQLQRARPDLEIST